MANSGSSDERTQALVVHLLGADFFIANGRLHDEHIGTLIRRGDVLVSAHPTSDSAKRCNRCSSTAVQLDDRVEAGWELLCAEHAYEGQWMTHAEMDRRIRQMATGDKPASAVAAFFNWAIKRVRG